MIFNKILINTVDTDRLRVVPMTLYYYNKIIIDKKIKIIKIELYLLNYSNDFRINFYIQLWVLSNKSNLLYNFDLYLIGRN